MQIQVKTDKDWDVWERGEMLGLLSSPQSNGGFSLPQGTNIAAAFDSLPSESLGVWYNGEPALCLSIIPIDHKLRTGLFHVMGNGDLPAGIAAKTAQAWLARFVDNNYSIRAFTKDKRVMRWGRSFGFDVWGQQPSGEWVGEFVLHN